MDHPVLRSISLPAYPIIACMWLLLTVATVAKNDIRQVDTGVPLSNALETLDLDGASCRSIDFEKTSCSYDMQTEMVLHYARRKPHMVEKIEYSFPYSDAEKIRTRLQALYGLKKDRIEGEHKLFTGERLLIDLGKDGKGTISIINDAQIEKDKAPDER